MNLGGGRAGRETEARAGGVPQWSMRTAYYVLQYVLQCPCSGFLVIKGSLTAGRIG